MPSLSTKERKKKFNKPLNYLISPSTQVDIESTDTIFSDLENECKLLGTKSKSLSLVLLKKLKEDNLRNMIEEFKDQLKEFKNLLNKVKKQLK